MAVSIPAAGRKQLRTRAGRTIPLRVVLTLNGLHSVTTVSLHVPG